MIQKGFYSPYIFIIKLRGMNMINICETINVGCSECPFRHECNLSFPTYGTKDYWLSELKDMLNNIEFAIKKVENADDLEY